MRHHAIAVALGSILLTSCLGGGGGGGGGGPKAGPTQPEGPRVAIERIEVRGVNQEGATVSVNGHADEDPSATSFVVTFTLDGQSAGKHLTPDPGKGPGSLLLDFLIRADGGGKSEAQTLGLIFNP